MLNVLFMCVANSARSQMAEGLGREILGDLACVDSAGSKPTSVNPFAKQVMNEIGIDLARHYSKTFEQLPKEFSTKLNYVITLCAEEVCPVVLTSAERLHWPLPDPAVQGESDEVQLRRFREARDAIRAKLLAWRATLERT